MTVREDLQCCGETTTDEPLYASYALVILAILMVDTLH